MINVRVYIFSLIILQYLQVDAVVVSNEYLSKLLQNTNDSRLDNIVAIVFQKTIGLPCQGHGKCLPQGEIIQISRANSSENEEKYSRDESKTSS